MDVGATTTPPQLGARAEPLPPFPVVPPPAAYGRQVSYSLDAQYSHHHDLYIQELERTQIQRQLLSGASYADAESARSCNDEKSSATVASSQGTFSSPECLKSPLSDTATEAWFSKGCLIICILLSKARILVRIASIVVGLASLCLIVSAIAAYNKPLIPSHRPITVRPCVVLSGVASMNLVISVSVLVFSLKSPCFKLSNNSINAIYAINGAVAFGSSMGACFLLSAQSALPTDLWAYSCDTARSSASAPSIFALSLTTLCSVIHYAWAFTLLQACLELFIFTISLAAFLNLKWHLFTNTGRFGRFF